MGAGPGLAWSPPLLCPAVASQRVLGLRPVPGACHPFCFQHRTTPILSLNITPWWQTITHHKDI